MMSEVIIKNYAHFHSRHDTFLTSLDLGNGWFKMIARGSHLSDIPYGRLGVYFENNIKPDTQYTLILQVFKNTLSTDVFCFGNDSRTGFSVTPTISPGSEGVFKFVATSKSDISVDKLLKIYVSSNGVATGEGIFRFMLLEGDWTDLELPSYFEGERVYNWQEPRLDWTTESYLNLEDMNRIEGNFDWLRWEMNSYFSKLPFNSKIPDYKRQLAQIDFYTTFNRVENNINSLKDRYFQHSQWINLPESYTDEYNIISYQNIYRLEKDLKLLYDLWQGMKSTWTYPGEIYCGEWGEY